MDEVDALAPKATMLATPKTSAIVDSRLEEVLHPEAFAAHVKERLELEEAAEVVLGALDHARRPPSGGQGPGPLRRRSRTCDDG